MSDTPTSPAPATVGRMIVELFDNGGPRPHPRITFDPVGRFTPGLIDHYQTLFFQEIERAHALARHAARASPPVITDDDPLGIDDTAPATARRRTR